MLQKVISNKICRSLNTNLLFLSPNNVIHDLSENSTYSPKHPSIHEQHGRCIWSKLVLQESFLRVDKKKYLPLLSEEILLQIKTCSLLFPLIHQSHHATEITIRNIDSFIDAAIGPHISPLNRMPSSLLRLDRELPISALGCNITKYSYKISHVTGD